MTEHQIGLNGVSSEVQIAVLHAQIISPIRLIFNGERWGLARIQDFELRHDDFDVTCCHLGIFGLTNFYIARHFDDKFTTEFARFQAQLFVAVHVEGELSQAITVPQIDKCHSTQISGALNPSAEDDLLTCMFGAQVAACMRSMHDVLMILSFGSSAQRYFRNRLLFEWNWCGIFESDAP